MNPEICKKKNCQYLGKMSTPESYGQKDVPYCEYAPNIIWGDRRISKMGNCPIIEKKKS